MFLFRSYDEDKLGYITHDQFLQKIGVNFAPGDDQGISRTIVDNSLRELDEHYMNMNLRHELQTYNQASTVWNMSVDTIYTQLRLDIYSELPR